MQILPVRLGSRSYDVAIGTGIEDEFAAFVRDRIADPARTFAVADSNTRSIAERLCGRLGAGPVAIVPTGESTKSLAVAGELYSRLARIEADRKTAVLAV